MIDATQVPLAPFSERDTIRLISTAYIDEPAIAPLVDDDDELAFLEAFEGLTSTRQNSTMPLPIGVFPQELLSERDGYGWSYVNAAFCYTRSTGNRFNGPDRGAWYATWGQGAIQTAHAEVSWHLTKELEATDVFDNMTSYRELLAGFIVDMHDLREFADNQVFASEPEAAYPKGQLLASALRQNGSAAILYPSVRHEGGLCLSAFRPRVVQNVRQGDRWLFEWRGSANPSISKWN